MIQYKIVALPKKEEEINVLLNNFSRDGWRVVCSCGKHDRHLILKRKIKQSEERYR